MGILKKEAGLYTNSKDSSFKTTRQVRMEMQRNGELPDMQHLTPVPKTKSLNDYLDTADKRSKQIKELDGKSNNHVKVSFPDTTAVHVLGDLHIGNPNTDHRRIAREVEAIKNSEDKVILAGDLVDGIFWGGESQSEQSLNLSEQRGALRGIFRSLRDKIVVAVSGEHDDKWASKTGGSPYEILAGETGAPYVRGIAEVEAQVGEEDYNVVVAHKMRGHSMYNKNHPTMRMSKFNLPGGDVYVSAHNHQKQISQEAVREIGNKTRQVTHIAIGPYKTKDGYGDRSGFVEQGDEQLGGASFRMHSKRKKVDVEPNIEEDDSLPF